MAYANAKSRPSGTSITAALAINGLMVAGIIFAAPNVTRALPATIIELIDPTVEPQTIPPKPVPDRPVEKQSAQPQDRTDPAPQTSARSGAETGYVLPPKPPELPGTGPIDPPPLPPARPDPVFRTAQINPRYANALQPTYPPGLIRAEMEGVVTVRVLIGTDGRVKQVEPVRSDDGQFLEATRRQALGKWRFIPATRDGEPVESWREMTVRFQLPD